jgi:hypothetical protein
METEVRTSGSKCGICFNGESVSHMACTHICDRSMAPNAFNQALDDITSTAADSRLRIFSSTRTWSAARSGGNCKREKCACSKRKVLKPVVSNFALSNLTGTRSYIRRRRISSWRRMGMDSNSWEYEITSSRPFNFVFSLNESV